MTPEDCRAARELLGWSVERLAAAAWRSSQTIRNFEAGRGRPHPGTSGAIHDALREAGVMFPSSDGDGLGVRLRKERG